MSPRNLSFDRLWKSLDPLVEKFMHDSLFAELFPPEQKDVSSVLRLLASIIFFYDQIIPPQWEDHHLEHCFYEEIPRKVAAPKEYFENIGIILEKFIQFMGKEGILTNMVELLDLLPTYEKTMLEMAEDSERWHIHKKLSMDMLPATKTPDDLYFDNYYTEYFG